MNVKSDQYQLQLLQYYQNYNLCVKKNLALVPIVYEGQFGELLRFNTKLNLVVIRLFDNILKPIEDSQQLTVTRKNKLMAQNFNNIILQVPLYSIRLLLDYKYSTISQNDSNVIDILLADKENPLLANVLKEFPDQKQEILNIGQHKYIDIQLHNEDLVFSIRKLSRIDFSNRNYIQFSRIPFHCYVFQKPKSLKNLQQFELIKQSSMNNLKYQKVLYAAKISTIKSLVEIFSLFQRKQNFNQLIIKTLQDVKQIVSNYTVLNLKFIKKCIDDILDVVKNISTKMETQDENINNIDFHILLMLIYKVQILPLLMPIKAAIMQQQLQTIDIHQCYNVISHMYQGLWYEMTYQFYKDFSKYVYMLGVKSDSSALNTILSTFQYVNNDEGNTKHYFSLYVKELIFQLNTDLAVINKQLSTWEEAITLLDFCFSFFGTSYIDGINFMNVAYTTSLTIFETQYFFKDEQPINVTIQTQNDDMKGMYNEIIRQSKFKQQYKFIDLQLLEQIIQSFSKELINIIISFKQLLQPKALEIQLYDVMQKSNELNAIKSITFKHQKQKQKPKLEDFNTSTLATLDQNTMCIDYSLFKDLYKRLGQKQDMLSEIQSFNLFVFGIHINIQLLNNKYQTEYDQIKHTLRDTIYEQFIQLSNVLESEILMYKQQAVYYHSNIKYNGKFNTFVAYLQDNKSRIIDNLTNVLIENAIKYIKNFGCEDVDRFFSLIYRPLDIIYLFFRDIFQLSKQSINNLEQINKAIKSIDNFIYYSSNFCYEKLQFILQLNKDQFQKAISNPQAFEQENKGKMEFNINLKIQFECNKEYELILLKCLCYTVKLEIHTNNYSYQDVCSMISQLASDKQIDEVTNNQNIQYADLKLHQCSENNIQTLISKINYTLQQLTAMRNAFIQWIQYIQKVQEGNVQSILKMKNHISPSHLYVYVQYLAKITEANYKVTMSMQNETNLFIRDFKAEALLEYVEQMVNTLKNITTGEDTIKIKSLLHDYINLKLVTEEQVKESLQTYDISFINMKEDLQNLYNSTIEYLEQLVVIYILKSNCFTNRHYLSISKMLKISLNVQLETEVSQILSKIQESKQLNQLLIVLTLYRQNALIEQEAKQQLEKIDQQCKSITIENVFKYEVLPKYDNRMRKPVSKQNAVQFYKLAIDVEADLNYVVEIITQPVEILRFTSESLAIISHILGNSNFMNGKWLKIPNTIDQKLQSIAQILNQQISITKIPKELREYEKYMTQSHYMHDTELKCRDLEFLMNMLKMITTIFKRMPLMLKDLINLYIHYNILQYKSHTVNLSINCFTEEQEQQLFSVVNYWQYIAETYLYTNQNVYLYNLAMNEAFIEQLTFTFEKVEELYNQINKNPNYSIITTFGNIYDKNGKFVSQKVDYTYTFKSEYNHIVSKVPISIIPTKFTVADGKIVYPNALLLSHIPGQILAGNFPSQLFKSQLVHNVMQQITEICYGRQEKHVVLTKIRGNQDEEIVFSNLVIAPQKNFEIIDQTYMFAKKEIINLAFKCWDFFIISVNKAIQKSILKTEQKIINEFTSGTSYVLLSQRKKDQQHQKQNTNLNEQQWQEQLSDNIIENFVKFINNTIYQIFIIVIATYSKQQYDRIKSQALKFQNIEKELQAIYLVFNQLVKALVQSNKSAQYKTAAKSRIQEWVFIFYEIKKINDQGKLYKNQHLIPNQFFPCLNFLSNNIFVTDLNHSYMLQTGSHWQGACLPLEENVLTSAQKFKINQFLQAFGQNYVVFALGQRNNNYQNKEFNTIIRHISRSLMKNVYHIFFTPTAFASQYKLLETCLVCGMISICYGIEHLLQEQIQTISDLAFIINQNKGQLKSLVECNNVQNIKIKEPLARRFLETDYVQYETLQNKGYIIFFSPVLNIVEQASRVTFVGDKEYKYDINVKQQHIKTKKDQVNNITYQYQFEVEQPVFIKQISDLFANSVMINIDSQNSQQEYIAKSQIYGSYYFNLSQFLFSMNNKICYMKPHIIDIIHSRVRDHANLYQICLLTYDFLIRQCLFFLNDDHHNVQLCKLLANVIAASFGVNMIQTQLLQKFGDQFFKQLEFMLQQASILRKNIALQKKQADYENFISEYLESSMNEEYHEQIYQHSRVYQINILMSIDIFNIIDLLKAQEPILLVSINQSHIKVMTNYISQQLQTEVFYITDKGEFDQAQNSIISKNLQTALFIVSPSSKEKYHDICTQLYEYFKTQDHVQISVILAITSMLYDLIKDDMFLNQFQLKYLTIPQYSSSFSIKQMFSANLIVDQELLNQKADAYFISHYLNQPLTLQTPVSEILRALYLKQTKTVKKHLEFSQLVQSKITVLQSYVDGIIAIFYQILQSIYTFGSSFEQILLWRSIMMYFLYNYKIVQLSIKKPQFNPINYELYGVELLKKQYNAKDNKYGYDAILRSIIGDFFITNKLDLDMDQYSRDSINLERQFMCQVLKIDTNLTGFDLHTIKEAKSEFEKIRAKNEDFETSLVDFHIQQSKKRHSLTGFGQNHVLQYNFDDTFIFKYYLEESSIEEGFKQIALPIAAAMHNAALLYYSCVRYGANQQMLLSEQLKQKYQARYSKFKYKLQFLQLGPQDVMSMNLFSTLMAASKKQYDNFNANCLKKLDNNFTTEMTIDHELTIPQQIEMIKELFTFVGTALPEYDNNIFSYIMYNLPKKDNFNIEKKIQQLYFTEYKLGEGILSNVSQLSDIEMLDQQVLTITEQAALNQIATHQDEDFENEINDLSDPADDKPKEIKSKAPESQHNNNIQILDINQLIEQQENTDVISIQKIPGQIIYLDTQRTAICTLIAACMQTPLTATLYGGTQTGKSQLIRIAALLCRNMVEYNQIILPDSTSEYVSRAIRQAIANRGQLAYHMDSLYLKYFQNSAFQNVHINASMVTSSDISDEVIQVMKDQYLRLHDSDIYIDCNQERLNGLLQIQETSFLVECSEQSLFNSITDITIKVPPLQQDFILEIFKKQFPHVQSERIKLFVSGYFMIKNNIKAEFLHNFQVINKIIETKIITVNNSQFFDFEKLKEISSNLEREKPTENEIFNIHHMSSKKLLKYITTNYKPSIIEHIRYQQDDKIFTLDIWAAFYIFQQYLEYKDNNQIKEKLPILALLGHISTGQDTDNPWNEYQKIKNNVLLMPVWQNYAVNSIFKAKYSNVNLQHKESKHFVSYERLTKLLDMLKCVHDDETFYLESRYDRSILKHVEKHYDRELLISLGMYSQNCYFFAEYMQLIDKTKEFINPYIANLAFQLFINLEIQKDKNISKLSTLVKYGLTNKTQNGLLGIYSDDDMFQAKHNLLYQLSHYSCILFSKTSDKVQGLNPKDATTLNKLLNQELDFLALDDESEISEQRFSGFSIGAVQSIQIPKYSIALKNADEQQYNQIILTITSLGGYDIAHLKPIKLKLPLTDAQGSQVQSAQMDDMRSLSQASTQLSMRQLMSQRFYNPEKGENAVAQSHAIKILINIDSVVNMLDNEIIVGGEYPKLNSLELDLGKMLMSIVKYYKSHYKYNQKQMDFIIIIYILRIAICLSVGIRPSLIFDENARQQYLCSIDIFVQSQLTSCFPTKVISGKHNIAQMPYKCINFQTFVQRQLQNKSSSGRNNRRLDQLSMLPSEIILIGTKSKFDRQSSTGVTAYQLLSNLVDEMSITPNFFTLEEQQAITSITAYNFGIESAIDQKLINMIIATNLSIIVVDTNQKSENLINTKNMGYVQQSMDQLNGLNKHFTNLHFYQDIYKKLEKVDKVIGNILTNPIFNEDTYGQIEKYIDLSQFNQSHYLIQNIKISNKIQCSTLQQKLTGDFTMLKLKASDEQDIIVISYHIYKYMNQVHCQPICSYQKYQEIIYTLYLRFLDRCKVFEKVYEKINWLYKQYQLMCSITQQEEKLLDIQKLSAKYVFNIINQIQYRTECVMKVEGFKIQQKQRDTQCAVGEVIILRDCYYSILQFLDKEMNTFQARLNTLALDCICCATYLIFIQPQAIDKEQIMKMIQNGDLSDVDLVLRNIQRSIENGNNSNDIYNLFILSIMQIIGYKVTYPRQYLKYHGLSDLLSEQQFKRMGYKEVCQHTQQYGADMFLNNYQESVALDSSAFMMARHYKLEYQYGDPYMLILNSAAIFSQLNYVNFIVNREVATAVGYVLALKGVTTYQATLKTMDLDDHGRDVECEKLIKDVYHKIFIIDMCDVIEEQEHIAMQAFKTSNPILIFYNFGAPNQNKRFFSQVLKLLIQKCSFVTRDNQKFIFGQNNIKSVSPLKDMIFVFGSKFDEDPLTKSGVGLLEQQVYDQLAILTVPTEANQKSDSWVYKNVEQKLQQAIFGQQQGLRSVKELIKLLNIQGLVTYENMQQQLDKIIINVWKASQVHLYNLKINPSGTIVRSESQAELSGNENITPLVQPQHSQEKMQNLVFENQIDILLKRNLEIDKNDKNQLYVVAINISQCMKKYRTILDNIFFNIQKIHISLRTKDLIFSDQRISLFNRPLYLRCLNFQIIRKLKIIIIDNLVKAIYYSLQFFNKFSYLSLPAFACSQEDTLKQICTQISSYCSKIAIKHINEVQDKFKLFHNELAYFAQIYPTTSYINSHLQQFKNEIVKIALITILQRSATVFKPEYYYAIYIFIQNIFITLCGLTNITSSDDYQNFKININDIQIVQQVLCSDLEDQCQVLTISSISSAVLPSVVTADKYMTVMQLSLPQIKQIKNIQPDICKINSILQYCWYNFIYIQRFNKFTNQQVSWYIKNNSSFVQVAQMQNLFFAYLRSFYNKDRGCFEYLNKKNLDVQYFDDVILDPFKVTTYIPLPPQAKKLDEGVSFAMFMQAIALQPHLLLQNLQIYGTIMSTFTDVPPQMYSNARFARAQTNVFGIINYNPVFNTLTVPKISQLMTISYQVAFKFLLDDVSGLKISQNLVSTVVYQLCNLIYLSSQVKVQDHNISIIYYDQSISIIDLLTYCYNILPNDMRGDKLQFSRVVNINMVRKYTVSVLVEPNTNGDELLQQLDIIIDQKSSLHQKDKINPIYLLIPSTTQIKRLDDPLFEGKLAAGEKQRFAFNQMFKMMFLKVHPMQVYISQPQDIDDAILHILTLFVACIQNNETIFRTVQKSKLKRLISMRGMMLFILKYAFFMVHNNIEYRDKDPITTYQQLINQQLFGSSEVPTINNNAQFYITGLNDYQFIKKIGDSGSKAEKRISNLVEQIVFDKAGNLYQMLLQYSAHIVNNMEILSTDQTNEEVQPAELVQESSSDESFMDLDDVQQSGSATSNALSNETSAEQSSKTNEFSNVSAFGSTQFNQNIRKSQDEITQVKKHEQQQNPQYDTYLQSMMKFSPIVKKIDANSIQQNISEIYNPQQRKIVIFGVPFVENVKEETNFSFSQQLAKSKGEVLDNSIHYSDETNYYAIPPKDPEYINELKLDKISQIDDLYNLLKEIRFTADTARIDLLNKNTNIFEKTLLRNSFGQCSVESQIRRVMSSRISREIVQQIYKDDHTIERQKFWENVEEMCLLMPDMLQMYVENLSIFQNNSTYANLAQNLSQEEIFRHMTQFDDHEHSPSDDKRNNKPAFIQQGEVWVIDAYQTISILGSLFFFQKIMCGLRWNIHSQHISIVITPKKPVGQVFLEKDGSLSYDTTNRSRGEVNYMKITGLTLYGIGYDQELETVCDITPMSKIGYKSNVILYAQALPLEYQNNDYFDENLPIQKHFVVNKRYVPIPIIVGGISRPFALLENKTDISSEYYLARNPYFGVKVF